MRIRGPVAPRVVSGDRMAALAAGNIDELLRINHSEFGDSTMMADSDDDDDDDDADDDDDDKGASGAGDDDDDSKKGDDSDSAAELEKLRKRMKAADKRADAAEQELKKRQDAEKGDLDKATETVAELQETVKGLTETVSTLRLENAFLVANEAQWHDPEVALTLARSKGYLEDVVDEDSGEVDKKTLKKALERLAKEHKYLVKSKEKSNNDDDDGPSGEPGGGRSDNLKDDKAKKQALKNRFPALNR